MASQENLGSSTEPILISINVFKLLFKKVQNSLFWKRDVLKHHRDALGGMFISER